MDASLMVAILLIAPPSRAKKSFASPEKRSHTNENRYKIIGFYLLAIGSGGSLALPKSPFWAGLVSALILIGAGYGWIS